MVLLKFRQASTFFGAKAAFFSNISFVVSGYKLWFYIG